MITSLFVFTRKTGPFLLGSLQQTTPVVLARAGKALIANITAATVNSRTKRFNTLYLLIQGEVTRPTMSRNNINNGNK